MADHEGQPAWAVEYHFDGAIKKAAETPLQEGLEPYQRRPMRPGDPMRISVNTVAEPTSHQGKRGYLISPLPGWSSYEIFCDEGTAIGGTDMAPSPLGYLTSAIGFCMLTHITGYLERNPMQVSRIKVEMRGEFWTSMGVAGDGGQGAGGCDAFSCAVIIDSDEPDEKVVHLTEVCRRACMAFETIARAVPTSTTLVLNGQPHAIDIAS